MKPFLRKLHRWLGLSVGLWAAMAGLTGSLLVFSEGIDRRLNPGLFPVPTVAEAAVGDSLPDLSQVEARVAAVYPQRPQLGYRLPRDHAESLVVRLGGETTTEIFLHPVNYDLLGARDQYGGLVGFFWDLHVHLLAGETGETIAGVMALLFFAMLIVGLLLWWPGRKNLARGLRIRLRGSLNARLFDLHSVSGAATLALLLVPVITGLMLVFHGPTNQLLLTTLGGKAMDLSAIVPEGNGTASRLPLARLLQAGDAALPDARAVSLSLPENASGPVIVRQRFAANSHPNGRSFVAVNPYTAEVMKIHDWRQAGPGLRVSDFKYPLHIGHAFGLPGRLLILVTGLVPAALLLTGGWLWWRRRPASGALSARQKRRPRPLTNHSSCITEHGARHER